MIVAAPGNDLPPGQAEDQSIAIRRGAHEADGPSCEPLGTITLEVVAEDDRTDREPFEFSLTSIDVPSPSATSGR